MKFPTVPTVGSAILILAGISLVTPALAVVSIDFVSIGNAGNAADPATGSLYGAVAYAYQIAKNETTISQYAEFLNAVAKTDTYSLYHPNMTLTYINGISRSGISGSFTYSVNPGSGNKPITFINWFMAARFTNWMHNGQLSGAQNNLTTEDGAYTLSGAVDGVSVVKNAGARIWIPSEDEWYKAAYFDPNKGGPGVGGYWAQATQSQTLAGNTRGVANSANYYDGDYVGSGTSAIPSVNALTDVGAYGLNSDSAYGTNDQGGNVSEWTDAIANDGQAQPIYRVRRGGSWIANPPTLGASVREEVPPYLGNFLVGFRVASVPEPSAFLLTLLSVSAGLASRRRSPL